MGPPAGLPHAAPAGTEPRQSIRAWAQRLGSLRLPPSGWVAVAGLALANWLADAAVLAVSIRATGAVVPWHDLLLVYGSGIAAQSLNITPSGLGVTERTLSLALVATGLGASQALAAVLLYRLASFWLVALAGWLVLLWLRRPRARRGTGPRRARPCSPADPAARRHQDTPVPETNPPSAPPGNRTPAMTADPRTTERPARLAAHELVLLHGQPGSPADWQPVTARLPAQLHAIAADRPGYGSSRLPAGGFAAGARAVLDDLDARGITRAVLAGHSYGGGVALAAAALAPRRVEAGRLLASVGPGCVTDETFPPHLAWAAVRDRAVPADAMDRPGPARRDRPAARPPATPGRARQLASLGPPGPRPAAAVAHLPGRATRPAPRARRARARHRAGPGAGPAARRPQGYPGTPRYRPPARPCPARCPPAAHRRRGSSAAQASPRCRRRRDRGVPGSRGRTSRPG